jgi:hypothetical protein
VPRELDRLSAAEIDDLDLGRQWNLSDLVEAIYWSAYVAMAPHMTESWNCKFSTFDNFVRFHKPPHLILPEMPE